MGKIKKFLFVIFTAVPGAVLTLAGLNIIEFTAKTQQLILYMGLFLLGIAFISYVLPSGTQKEEVVEQDKE